MVPKWLDADEERLWRAFIEASSRVLQAVEHDLKADAEMTFDDYEVLVHLSEAEGRRLRMTDLSERLVHSPSRLTQRIDRMADRGWVCREKCPEDRRGTFAVLTDDGFDAIAAAAPAHVASVRRHLLDRLEPNDVDALAALLDDVLADDDPAGEPPGDQASVDV